MNRNHTYGIYGYLPKMRFLHVPFFGWAHSSWYQHKCLVVTMCHFFLRISAIRFYAFSFKHFYHLSFKVSRATHQTQNPQKIWTKVGKKDCPSGLHINAAVIGFLNSSSMKSGVFVSPLNITRPPRRTNKNNNHNSELTKLLPRLKWNNSIYSSFKIFRRFVLALILRFLLTRFGE